MRTGLSKRIFVDVELSEGNFCLTDHQTINRISKVLRLKEGDEIVLFSREQKEWLARIITVKKREIVFDLLSSSEVVENSADIILAFSPIKPERMRFLLEKCTEIGVTKFIPVIFDRTIIRKVNREKLDHYIIAASEQSGRVSVPGIEQEKSLSEFLKASQEAEIIFCNEKEDDFLINKVTIKGKQIVIIGPEGGFTDQEREMLESQANVKSVSLGKNILRAETASIFAVGYLAALQISH